ncbi:hypothetical protein HY488_03040 [Candidatus Woesearchaeota archaeon]|nr:hypothetical protein [Candidatus Woesearchaeota archaeon]
MRQWAAGFIILLLVLACTTEKPTKPSKIAKARNITNASLSAEITNTTSTPLTNETINASNETDEIRVRRLSDEEIEQLNRNTKEFEALRERRYGTRIDLTQVDAYNCRFKIEELEKERLRLAEEVDDLGDERTWKRHEADQAKQAYEAALASGDSFAIETTRFDYTDAENEYDEVKKEFKEAHDNYDETERTLRILKPECDRMRTDAGLRN